MGKIIVTNHLTLDGVMQAPAHPDEDRRGGFDRGGWAARYQDEVMSQAMGQGMARSGSLLLGRRTYENLAAYWPHQTDNPFTEVLNNRTKYVASNTLREPLPWVNSVLLAGDAAAAVKRLKAELDEGLAVLGSGDLIQSLQRNDLIDEYVLTIHPLVLGSGRRLFVEGGPPATLRLVDTTPTTTGVIIATYRTDSAPAGDPGQDG